MSDVEQVVVCRYCLSKLAPAARKCKECLEFVDRDQSEGTEWSATAVDTYKATIEGIAKAALPIVLAVALIVYHSELSNLLLRARTARFADTQIEFDVPGLSDGTIKLNPISLYYLLGAAKRKGTSSWPWDKIRSAEREQIYALQAKGLAEITIEKRTGPPSPEPRLQYNELLRIRPTEAGYKFVKSLGLGDIIASD